MHLIPMIPTVPHMSQSVHYCQRCDYYKEIYRIWKVCAQGSLGRGQVLFKIARFHIGYNLFAPYLLFYCTDFSQIWYPWKAIFEENPAPYVTKDEDYSLWKTSAITEIAPLGSFWRYW